MPCLTCGAPALELRRRLCSNQAVQWVLQCLSCGSCTNPRKASDFSAEERASAPDVDEGLRETWWRAQYETRCREREAQAEERTQERLSEMSAYYESREWLAKSRKVRNRDYTCRAGLRGCDGLADQAHHLTYDHFGDEPLFDLVGVCTNCHRKLTEMDRKRRGQA